MAIDIRDNERQGRAELEMIDEGSEPEAVIEVSFCFFRFYIWTVLFRKLYNLWGYLRLWQRLYLAYLAARKNVSAMLQPVCLFIGSWTQARPPTRNLW